MQCQRKNGKVLLFIELFNDVIDHLGIFHYQLVIGKALVTEKSTATLGVKTIVFGILQRSPVLVEQYFLHLHELTTFHSTHGLFSWDYQMRQEITHTHLQSQAIMGENSYFVALYPQLIKDSKMSLPLLTIGIDAV